MRSVDLPHTTEGLKRASAGSHSRGGDPGPGARAMSGADAVSPGDIETLMTASAPDPFRRASIDAAPLGRPGRPEEVAEFLSDAVAGAGGSR
jgi:hypothetical protein